MPARYAGNGPAMRLLDPDTKSQSEARFGMGIRLPSPPGSPRQSVSIPSPLRASAGSVNRGPIAQTAARRHPREKASPLRESWARHIGSVRVRLAGRG
jgi:hypothetical protein